MDKTSVHVVAHTHWDREWHLPFEEFRSRLVRLVDGLLDILESEPDFTCFMLDGQTIVLDDYLELRPRNAERLRRLARAGRILVGPWYVLPDEVLVSGESLIRNLAKGIRQAAEFGGAMPVGYVPDQFSHSIDLPTVLRGFGLETACLWRGVGPEVGTQAFRWRAPTGAEVLVAYLATSYSNAASILEEPKETAARIEQAVDALRPFAVTPVYLLMNGTDHQFATAGTGRLLAGAQATLRAGSGAEASSAAGGEAGARPWRVRLSSLPAYIAELREELGEREDDLLLVTTELRSGYRAPILVATFSSRIRQKQRNDRLETLLTRTAEPLSVMAWLAGAAPYPEAELDYAWQLLLRNHPHDSICGCSVDVVHREIETRFDKAEQVAGQVVESALGVLRERLVPGPGVVTVVNTNLAPTGGLVEVTVPAAGAAGRSGAAVREGLPGLVDPEGREVPVQPVAAGSDDVLYDLTVSPGQLRAFLPFISGRKVQGMFINAVSFSRPSPEEIRMEAVIGERAVGELDWQAAKAEIGRCLTDRSVARFHVVARRSPQRRIAFVARGVPGLGWKHYRLAVDEAPVTGSATTMAASEAPAAADRARVTGPTGLENGFYRVSVNADGTLDVTEKAGGRTLQGLHRLVDGGDRGDLYTYCPLEADTVIDRPAKPVKVRLIESGPVRATLEVIATYRLPPSLAADRRRRRRARRRDPLTTVTTRVGLVAGEPLVRLRTSFNNNVADHRLRAVFPLGAPLGSHYALSHFSIVDRPTREPAGDPASWAEPPSGIWPHRGFFGAGGLTVFAKGLPEYTVMEATPAREAALALTLVRSVGWLSREDLPVRPGHAGPGVPTPEGQGQGPHTLDYALAMGDQEEAVALHRRYTGGLLALGGVLPLDGALLPDGVLPSEGKPVGESGAFDSGGLLELSSDNPSVVATAVKKACAAAIPPAAGPGGETLVVRLVNYSGRAARVALKVAGCGSKAGDGAAEAGEAAQEGFAPLDLAERPVPAAPRGTAADAGEPDSTMLLGPWQVATVGLRRR